MTKSKIIGLCFLFSMIISCKQEAANTDDDGIDPQYRQEMRSFVIELSGYAKLDNPSFLIIPQNGHELVTMTPGSPDGDIAAAYLSAIDGLGREDLFFGYDDDNKATAKRYSDEMIQYLDRAVTAGITVLVTDYCSDHSKIDASYTQNNAKKYVSFAADSRGLDTIPVYPSPIYGANSNNAQSLGNIRNFLYLIDPGNYSGADSFIASVRATDYDLVIVDLFFDDEQLTPAQVAMLKTKANGGERPAIAYMSIGEAEDYRWYWDPAWKKNRPSWLKKENPDWEGNYIVEYWDPAWKAIIFGSADSYLDRIMEAGFDGAYLDIIDGYESFE